MTAEPSRINPFLCCQQAAEMDQTTRSQEQEVDTKSGENANELEQEVIAQQDPNQSDSPVAQALAKLNADVAELAKATGSAAQTLSAQISADQADIQAVTAGLSNKQQQDDAIVQKWGNTSGNTDTNNLAQVTQLMAAQNSAIATSAQILAG